LVRVAEESKGETLKVAAIFLLSVCLFSCSKSGRKPSPEAGVTAGGTITMPRQERQEPEPWKSIREKMESRHLHWNVFCDSSNEQESYLAYAYVEGEHMGGYVEDGGKPYWTPHKRYRTREEAGVALSKLVAGPPNTYPEHQPHNEKTKTHCLAEVGTDSHYSECKDCEEKP
jgi:hypothetical protein